MQSKKRGGLFVLFVTLLIFWTIIAADWTVTQFLVGVVASALIVLYSYDLIFNEHEVTKLTFKTALALLYIGVRLLFEIVKANLQVAKIVLSPSLPIQPGFIKIRQPLKKAVSQTLYGNSITLTPGTLTVDMNEQEIIIHTLILDRASTIENSKMERAFIKYEAGGKR